MIRCRPAAPSLALLVLLAFAPAVAQPVSPPSDVSFNLKRSFLAGLMTGGTGGQPVGARWSVSLRMGAHSAVHGLEDDCEMHVAAKLPNNRVIAHPAGIVVEPPNVCERRVPQIRQTGRIRKAWTDWFDDNVEGKSCVATGFPRVFTEHSAGGEDDGSNPDHVVEIHPATALSCGGVTLDFIRQIDVFPGMRRITDASTLACLERRRLYVRQRGSGSSVRYEFLEEGAQGGNARCGNFAIVDAHVGKEYLRTLTNGGDHLALAQAWIGESGPFPLKIYTYQGTPEDDRIAGLLADPDETKNIAMRLHGLLTYDYATIAGAVQDAHGAWLQPSALRDYKEIRNPLALVVFGEAVD